MGNVGLASVDPHQHCIIELGSREACTPGLAIAQVGTSKVRPREVRALEMSTLEMGTRQWRLPDRRR